MCGVIGSVPNLDYSSSGGMNANIHELPVSQIQETARFAHQEQVDI